jgi:tripartite-type tricarboxylate transporter receptor subunit TctC
MVARRALLWGFAALVLAAAPVRADAVADFYQGRTITVYIASGPGGGYDAYGRLLAQHIVAHLPGKPQALVLNMPGAGGRTLANFLYNKAPQDGTVIGILQAPIIMDPLIDGKDAQGVLYDPLKFSWIGSLDQFTPIAVVWNTTGIKTIADAKGKEINFGSSGGDVSERLYANILNTFLGTKFVAVAGYNGSAEIALAMERGEVPAFVGWYWAGMKRTKPEWLDKKSRHRAGAVRHHAQSQHQGRAFHHGFAQGPDRSSGRACGPRATGDGAAFHGTARCAARADRGAACRL